MLHQYLTSLAGPHFQAVSGPVIISNFQSIFMYNILPEDGVLFLHSSWFPSSAVDIEVSSEQGATFAEYFAAISLSALVPVLPECDFVYRHQ